jgi:predicted ribosome quality control (RQC) complex YloA/Tae2 family protein
MKEIIINDNKYYIGENSRENDEIYKIVPNNSIWFHLDQGPSSHVYLVFDKKISRTELKQGAMFVRQYSKGQGRVIYLEKKYIKLIGGGQVEMLKDPKII